MKHRHGWGGKWIYGGPGARYRYCAKKSCTCKRECCHQTEVNGRWSKPKSKRCPTCKGTGDVGELSEWVPNKG